MKLPKEISKSLKPRNAGALSVALKHKSALSLAVGNTLVSVAAVPFRQAPLEPAEFTPLPQRKADVVRLPTIKHQKSMAKSKKKKHGDEPPAQDSCPELASWLKAFCEQSPRISYINNVVEIASKMTQFNKRDLKTVIAKEVYELKAELSEKSRRAKNGVSKLGKPQPAEWLKLRPPTLKQLFKNLCIEKKFASDAEIDHLGDWKIDKETTAFLKENVGATLTHRTHANVDEFEYLCWSAEIPEPVEDTFDARYDATRDFTELVEKVSRNMMQIVILSPEYVYHVAHKYGNVKLDLSAFEQLSTAAIKAVPQDCKPVEPAPVIEDKVDPYVEQSANGLDQVMGPDKPIVSVFKVSDRTMPRNKARGAYGRWLYENHNRLSPEGSPKVMVHVPRDKISPTQQSDDLHYKLHLHFPSVRKSSLVALRRRRRMAKYHQAKLLSFISVRPFTSKAEGWLQGWLYERDVHNTQTLAGDKVRASDSSLVSAYHNSLCLPRAKFVSVKKCLSKVQSALHLESKPVEFPNEGPVIKPDAVGYSDLSAEMSVVEYKKLNDGRLREEAQWYTERNERLVKDKEQKFILERLEDVAANDAGGETSPQGEGECTPVDLKLERIVHCDYALERAKKKFMHELLDDSVILTTEQFTYIESYKRSIEYAMYKMNGILDAARDDNPRSIGNQMPLNLEP